MKSSICRIAFLPDLHMGKPRIRPEDVHAHLEELVYPKIESFDLIVFGGDFFDSALTMNSDAGVYSAMIIDEVLSLAVKHKVFIRVLTGTFFHDRYQNRFFEIKSKSCGTIDGVPLLRVIDTIELEYIKPLKISLVYCPDNQPDDPTGRILDTLKVHHMDKVDFLCSHGYYEYLLPKGIPHIPPNMLDYKRLNPHIAGYILNGHVHIPVVREKLISGGSFERLAHGEEHDKGYFIIDYNTTTRTATNEFIVNKLTTPFITISISSYPDMDACLKDIENRLAVIHSTHGPNATVYLRLDGLSSLDTFVISYLEEKYSNVIPTIKSKTPQDITYDLDEVVNTLPTITEDNLPQLIYDNIKDKDITLDEIKELL